MRRKKVERPMVKMNADDMKLSTLYTVELSPSRYAIIQKNKDNNILVAVDADIRDCKNITFKRTKGLKGCNNMRVADHADIRRYAMFKSKKA